MLLPQMVEIAVRCRKYDPRSNKSDLKPEHKKGDYLDALVKTAADFYGPYADLFAVMVPENHRLRSENI